MTEAQTVRVAITQFAMAEDPATNIARAAELVRLACAEGAQVVLLPELFSSHYFPREMDEKFFALAHPASEDPALRALAPLAKELQVVLPVSFFERAGDAYFNSLVVLDADGRSLGVYRKTHIPDGTGYEEKFYFSPGDTGFKRFDTRYAKLGIGICWDQWFPETARALTLLGSDVLLYPTAIGSEPVTGRDTSQPWRRAMIGHAVSNTIHVAASNRVGREGDQVFYGTSFIADPWGEIVTDMNRTEEGVRCASLNVATARTDREWMGLLRDRRPETYGLLVGNK
ncbi:MAG TPA: nitrilase-related carbon-nitrogen hydrolase [Polyangiales bacterium]|nr:nitrilase-related carbon-nitrogen hydrolase [Polyangiales bacterium]